MSLSLKKKIEALGEWKSSRVMYLKIERITEVHLGLDLVIEESPPSYIVHSLRVPTLNRERLRRFRLQETFYVDYSHITFPLRTSSRGKDLEKLDSN